MISELKAERRRVVKEIGNLQKQRQYLDIQIAVVSAEQRVKISEAKKRKIYPIIVDCMSKDMELGDIARKLNNHGFRNGEKQWRSASVLSLWEAGNEA